MTARSIPSEGAGDYASYLESKTVPAERGDYYLGKDGEPIEAPGRWLARPESLASLGIDGTAPVERDDFVALMQGRRPGTSDYLRPAGARGARNAGVDMTFSAPKSVSVAMSLGDDAAAQTILECHQRAVAAATQHVLRTVRLTTIPDPAGGRAQLPAPASDLLAAEFVHRTARSLKGRAPDPQLHSHVVVTSVVKTDGRVAAVRDRMVYRAAREGGAYYRAELAANLQRAGFAVRAGTGKDGRYFELDEVSDQVIEAFSGRSGELRTAVAEFEERNGRAPSSRELQVLKVATREAKLPRTERELREAWEETARGAGGYQPAKTNATARFADRPDAEWSGRVSTRATREHAAISAGELRSVLLEQAAGRMAPETALAQAQDLADQGVLIPLEGEQWTTREMRDLEESLVERAEVLAADSRAGASERALRQARDQVAERIGGPMSPEQLHAHEVLAGPGRLAVLEGQAGTGKGVVIDATARSEWMAGRQVLGVALAGATAQRLGEDSPALRGHTTTIASLLARQSQTGQAIGPDTTVIVDEAGMVETPVLEQLVRLTEDAGGKLIAVGDGKQLPAIGPGGMFDRLAGQAPRAELTEVRRTRDPQEQDAWRALRKGDAATAMGHYLQRDQLHLQDDRRASVEAAVKRYDEIVIEEGIEQVALMSDGSTREVMRMNDQVQQLRLARGELGADRLDLPAGDHGPQAVHTGDLITWRKIQPVAGQARIENGSRGFITQVDEARDQLTVTLIGSDRQVSVAGRDELEGVRLGYAQHVVRQQGATVNRAIAVTGGWQTAREGAYVQASRARNGIDWYVARDELDPDGTSTLGAQLDELSRRMARTRAKTASVQHDTTDQPLTPGQPLPQPDLSLPEPAGAAPWDPIRDPSSLDLDL